MNFDPIQNIKSIHFCAACSSSTHIIKARAIEETTDGCDIIMFVECVKCSTATISRINYRADGVRTQGFTTDLDYDEVLKFRRFRRRISVDDVIEIHEQLQEGQHFDIFFKKIANQDKKKESNASLSATPCPRKRKNLLSRIRRGV